MNEIDTLDLKGFVTGSITRVFDTMLSMDVQLSDSDPQAAVDGSKIVGSVSFAGALMGSVRVHVNDAFARIITAEMLGMEVEEIEGDEEVHDVIGELSNMVGGDLKSRLDDIGLSCQLSIPSITSGSDFKIESMGWERNDRFTFCCRQHAIMVEACIKPGN